MANINRHHDFSLDVVQRHFHQGAAAASDQHKNVLAIQEAACEDGHIRTAGRRSGAAAAAVNAGEAAVRRGVRVATSAEPKLPIRVVSCAEGVVYLIAAFCGHP